MPDFKNLRIKKPVYYVPSCPSCGSKMTGRFIRLPVTMPFVPDQGDAHYILEQSVLHGERIRFRSRIPQNNCFCVACGYTWQAPITEKWMTKGEIAKEIKERGLSKEYAFIKKQKEMERVLHKNDKFRKFFPLPFRYR